MRRVIAVIVGVMLLLGFSGRMPTRLIAAPTDFVISAVDCFSATASITITNTNTGASSDLANLYLAITPPGGTTTSTLIENTVQNPASGGNHYSVPAGGNLILQLGPAAAQNPAGPYTAPATLPNNQTLKFSTTNLLQTGALIQLTNGNGGPVVSQTTCQVSFPQPANCTATPGVIFIALINGNGMFNLSTLSVRITSTATGNTPFVVQISAVINPNAPNYVLAPGLTYSLLVGSGATQNPTTAVPPTTPPQIALTTQNLLVPGARIDLLSSPTGSVITSENCPQGPTTQRVLIVSPQGYDFIDAAGTQPNTVCGPDLPQGQLPTAANPGPCFTIQNALTYAKDGDTIYVEFGIYEICQPIVVNKLVTISTRGAALSGAVLGASLLNNLSPGGGGSISSVGTATAAASATAVAATSVNLAVLHSFNGGPVFIVTAQGFPAFDSPANLPNTVGSNNPAGTTLGYFYHAQIDGFHSGVSSNPATAAIVLQNDSNTVVSNNIIGGDPVTNANYTGQPCTSQRLPGVAGPATTIQTEDMSNAAGILLQNSDHPDIYNNAIIGGANFQFSPLLATGTVLTGFGIVSSECLGLAPDSSDGVIVSFNLIAKNVNAGIWLCSDGGGGHLINTSTIRNNGRGVVLRAISNSLLDTDTISDNYQDAIVIYDAATNNTIQKSIIESSRTPGAAGIRLGGFGGGLAPLQTNIYNNTIMRDDTGIIITGARNTSIQYNVITANTGRTGVLIQVGSTGAPAYTQPTGTVFRFNQIVANGQCGATTGCAIRLDQGVTADVDASQNNFGLPPGVDPNTVLWHKPNDPTLGYIAHDASNLVPGPQSAATAVGAPGAYGLPNLTAPTSGPVVGVPGGVGAPAGAGTIPTIAPVSVTATPTPSPTPVPGAGTQGGTTGTSPQLQAGPPGGSTTYQAGCNYVTVPQSAGPSISVASFLSLFQPVSNIFAAYVYDKSSQQYQAIYFNDPTIPVQASTLVPGNIVAICVTDTVTGPP